MEPANLAELLLDLIRSRRTRHASASETAAEPSHPGAGSAVGVGAVSAILERCGWCDTTRQPLQLVGIIEQNSGPGGSIHACPRCMNRCGIVPVEEWPPGWRGGVCYRPRAAR
jgi:hypothetical protein